MTIQLAARLRFLAVGSLLLLAPRAASPQATLYTAGDPAAASSVLKGREVCGTSPASMAATGGASYDSFSASQFAAVVPEVHGSVPNPMGKQASVAEAGTWGVTVANPTRNPLTVTRIEIDNNNTDMFGAIIQIQPTTGWTGTQDIVSWNGSLTIGAHTTLDFIVLIRGHNETVTTPITLRATTSAGVLTSTAFSSAQRNGNAPYVNLPFMVNGVEAFSGNAANNGAVENGVLQTYTVRVRESENEAGIPTGTRLTITLPPGFTSVTAASGQTGFAAPTVTAPVICSQGYSITVFTNANIQNASRTFQFSAVAPPNQGGIGLYPIVARLENATTTPPIDTRTEFTQEVGLPPSTGVPGGIASLGAYLAIPNPMGSNKFVTFGVAVANPVDTPYTVTKVQLRMTGLDQFFKAVTAIRPTTGWTRPSTSIVEWNGSKVVDPRDAENFIVSIQGNGKNGVDRPLQVTVNGTVVSNSATTQNTNNPPAAALYYLVSGQPAVYTYGVTSGEPKTFQVVIKETQNVNINAGAELKMVIPAGWSAVSAPTTQAGFTTRTIVQPGPSTPGEVRTTVATAFKNGSRTFTFTATAPPNLLSSLFVFPTTLTSSQVRSTCDMLVQVSDASGGLLVEHLSPPIAESNVNQIDVHVVAGAAADTGFASSIFNFTTAAWEPLANATLGAAPSTLLSSVTSAFDQYFDAPLASPAKHLKVRMKATAVDNYQLNEDYVAFIVSEYRVVPAGIAPVNTFRGATDVPMLALGFETEAGSVDLYTVKIQATGSDPINDVTLVHLFEDLNCNGAVNAGEAELGLATLAPDASVTFGAAPTPLLSFSAGAPACALIAYDISASAGAFDVVGAQVTTGFDLTSSVGQAYPFPAVGGYPIDSGDSLIPGGPPALILDKTFAPPLVPPATRYPVGTTVTYAVTASNIGESASTNVRVLDQLDAAWAPYTGVITPLDGGSLCLPPSCASPRVLWPVIPSLAGNGSQTATLRFSATIPKTVADGAVVPNTAEATSVEQPAGETSNQSGLPVCAPVIAIDKTLPPTPSDYAVGEIIQWTIAVHNTGSCDATGLTVTDVVDVVNLDPATLVFTGATGTWDAPSSTYRWTIATLSPNATATLTVSGTIQAVAQGRNLCNAASVVWNQGTAALSTNPPGGTCSSVPVVPPRCAVSLVVDKTLPQSPADYAEGEPIEWTITVRNNGNCAATGVSVRDTLDTSVIGDPIVFTPDTGTYDIPSATYTWPATSVAGGGAEVLTFKVQGTILTGTEGFTVCNSARVAYDQGGEVLSNPTTGTCASVPVQPQRCSAPSLPAPWDLVLIRSGAGRADVIAGWTGDANAREQHLNQVSAKADIASAKRAPAGVGVATCTGATSGCILPGAATTPGNVFYQAFSACGATGADEGAY